MIGQNTTAPNDSSSTKDEGSNSSPDTTREKEQGDASEPDAPTAGEENKGMSTILDGELGTGVQADTDDQ